MQQKHLKSLTNRLRRISGQVQGLEKMVVDNQYCVDVIIQSRAIQKSLESFTQELLKNHLEEHVAHQFMHGEKGKAVSEMLKIYNLNNR